MYFMNDPLSTEIKKSDLGRISSLYLLVMSKILNSFKRLKEI